MLFSLGITAVGELLPADLDRSEIPSALERGLREDHGRWMASYPGLLSSKGRLVLILPRIYAGTPVQHLGDEPLVFIGALCRVMREARRSVVGSELSLDQALLASADAWRLLDRLEAALLLLEDFSEHGVICIHERHSSTRVAGTIHWPRTLARSCAIASGPNVTIADPVQTRIRANQYHPLTLLHGVICAEVHALLGRKHTPFTSQLPQVGEVIRRHRAVEILDRYERMLFRDRHRIVAGLLRRYLGSAGLGDAREPRSVSGVLAVDFPLVWERMLSVALGPGRRHPLPTGNYRSPHHQSTSSQAVRGLLLKPDLVIGGVFNNELVTVVIDAKDYAPHITGHWPRTESITKQLLYRYLLSDRYAPDHPPIERVGNAFLMPARMARGGDARGDLAHRATHDICGEVGAAPFGRIVCFDVDFARVARAYAHGQGDRELRDAIIAVVMQAMHEQ